MSTKYAPVFKKDDLNEYIVPSVGSYDTRDAAIAAGASANLQNTYGLTPDGTGAILEEGDYQGPFIIASVGDKTAWIIGGPTLDGLLDAGHPAVENAPSIVAETDIIDSDALPNIAVPNVIVTDARGSVGNGDHHGPDVQ